MKEKRGKGKSGEGGREGKGFPAERLLFAFVLENEH